MNIWNGKKTPNKTPTNQTNPTEVRLTFLLVDAEIFIELYASNNNMIYTLDLLHFSPQVNSKAKWNFLVLFF